MSDPNFRGFQGYRILCTGSRTWDDVATLAQAIERHARTATGSLGPVFVHGACPTGADALVEKYCRTMGNYPTERHPAEWDKFPLLAGHKRNQDMVNLGADICLAFCEFCTQPDCRPRDHVTHGTRDCIQRATEAGILVRQIWSKNDLQERLF